MIIRQASHDICALNLALKSYRDSIGKPTQRYHYVNEARLIHYSLTGRNQVTSDIKPVTRLNRKIYTQVVCLNRQLISQGVDYKLRSQVCRQIVENQKNNSPT